MSRRELLQRRRPSSERGLTLLEVLIVMVILALLVAVLIPLVIERLERARLARVVTDLKALGDEISVRQVELGVWPGSLSELAGPARVDAWGRPYQYLASSDPSWRGKSRRDRFLVPLNTDFDLYSLGPDGESRAPLVSRAGRDDIVRADNGAYYGPADEF